MVEKIKDIIKKLKEETFFRFALAGVINTAFGMAVMFGAYNLIHFSYEVSTALNYILGSILSYFLNKYYTFRNKKTSLKQIALFIINIFICYVLAYGLSKKIMEIVLSSQTVEFRENMAMLLGMILFVFMNYLGQKLFVFKKDIHEMEEELEHDLKEELKD